MIVVGMLGLLPLLALPLLWHEERGGVSRERTETSAVAKPGVVSSQG
jgi:hypothetical protein